MSHQDFEKYAEQKKFNYSVPEKFRSRFEECLNNIGKPLSSVKLLDFGCGDGKHHKYFLDMGLAPENIFGVEVSQRRVDRCHEIGWKNVFFIADEKTPFGGDEFDIINMAEVIEHIPAEKAGKTLAELTRIVKKDGFVIITTPNYPIKRFYDVVDAVMLRDWKRMADDPTHVNLFTANKLDKFLSQYFEEVEIFPYKHGFLFDRISRNFFLHKMLAVCSIKK